MPPLPSASRGSTHKTYAHLTILSESLSPQRMQADAGVSADLSWAQGDLKQGHRVKNKFNGVEWLSTRDRINDDPSDHATELVDRLQPHASRLAALSRSSEVHSCRFWIYWSTSGENPGLELSPEVIRGVADIGAALAIDIYVVK